MHKNKVDFFLSFQFLENNTLFNDFYNNYISIENIENIWCNYKQKTIDSINSSIHEYIVWNKLTQVWLLFSGWIDSLIILHYLRIQFPDIDIYTFTLHWKEASDQWNTMVWELKNIYNIHHQDFIFPNTLDSIIDILKHHYSSGYELKWDEGLIYYDYLFQKISNKYPNLSCLSGDGADIIFGGLSLYKLSFFEREENRERNFSSIYEEQYFEEKRSRFEKDFFYKYWEYFGGKFLWNNWGKTRNIFFKYFEKFKNTSWTPLKKQIIFNICFWLSHRQKFIFDSADNHDCKVFSPFLDRKFISKILALWIPDEYLLSEFQGKIILKEIYDDIRLKSFSKDFLLVSSSEIDFKLIFQNSSRNILKFALFLQNKDLISKEHACLVVYFMKYSHWYENRVRIYLLISLYCFITSDI